MKREILFRAWDLEEKTMHYVCPVSSFHGVSSSNGKTNRHDKQSIMTWSGQVYWNEGKLQDLVLLQWTGLKDKNHKPIYEGDIVRADESHFVNILKAEENAKYTHGQVLFICQGFNVCQESLGRTPIHEFATCECCPCGLEVIGNIYEKQN
jgi:uncharacterized phage protein (TIGR01671 family)